LDGVIKGLEPRRGRFPLVAAKVGATGSCPQPAPAALIAALPRNAPAIRGGHPAPIRHGTSAGGGDLPDAPDRLAHLRRGERRGCHLVEQRLKEVMVCPVQHRYVYRFVLKRLGSG